MSQFDSRQFDARLPQHEPRWNPTPRERESQLVEAVERLANEKEQLLTACDEAWRWAIEFKQIAHRLRDQEVTLDDTNRLWGDKGLPDWLKSEEQE